MLLKGPALGYELDLGPRQTVTLAFLVSSFPTRVSEGVHLLRVSSLWQGPAGMELRETPASSQQATEVPKPEGS